jgi:uncharacterized protein (TIGR02599 family)
MRTSLTSAFTLVELMVSMAVLTLILLLTMSMTNSVSTMFTRTRARIDTFQEARAGFEAMTRKVSQAMLNTYWDYEYPNNDTKQPPTAYVRQSELHFVAGPTKTGPTPLLPDPAIESVTHGIFFQAPQGYTIPVDGQPQQNATLNNLLNVSGYFVEFGSDEKEKPKFLKQAIVDRHRFRLMEMTQATEYLGVYRAVAGAGSSASGVFNWFREPLKSAYGSALSDIAPPVRSLAENVIALVVHPRRSPNDPVPPGAPAHLAADYRYDSRLYMSSGDKLAQLTRNQLPPWFRSQWWHWTRSQQEGWPTDREVPERCRQS